ncbi:hypothetical protein O0I10_005088 [Lichtheimia ornata]|uniref:CBS domain-containing protein n=1 Tax=Lichtheimia ornata TaxID=688661 RepID=A0AAD7V584_9FUNG|nr:uncharacterized protein O0I10_005088 [Lichtheimia ornata]KAJ8659050.1 hypothetical protein O0I10_005088 [Lichtheimia ornata]
MEHREGISSKPHDWCMIPAGNLMKQQHVITIDGSLPVEEACKILIKNNISSAPVYDSRNNHNGKVTEYVGMFDYGDVIAYILLVLMDQMPPHMQEPSGDDDLSEVTDLIRRAVEGQAVPVRLASDLSRKNPFYSILPESTLLSAIEEFACGTHRVCVLEPSGEVKGILSQSTVIEYLYNNRKQFPTIEKLLGQTLRHLGLGETDVISANADARVLDALSIMSQYGVSSVVITGANGVALGNISMTDIKHVMKGFKKSLLWITCFQFVSMVRTEQGIEDGQDRLPVFDVRLDTTLGFTIAKMLATRAHRVWVSDDMGRPIGVISMTDISRVIVGSTGAETSHYPRRASLATRRDLQ